MYLTRLGHVLQADYLVLIFGKCWFEIKKKERSIKIFRQTNKTVCCDGWQGLACDQPSTSISQQSFATCHLWSQDYIRTFDGTYYQFPGRFIS